MIDPLKKFGEGCLYLDGAGCHADADTTKINFLPGRKLCRSKKRRIIKKWFRRTGWQRGRFIGKKNGLYWYTATIY